MRIRTIYALVAVAVVIVTGIAVVSERRDLEVDLNSGRVRRTYWVFGIYWKIAEIDDYNIMNMNIDVTKPIREDWHRDRTTRITGGFSPNYEFHGAANDLFLLNVAFDLTNAPNSVRRDLWARALLLLRQSGPFVVTNDADSIELFDGDGNSKIVWKRH